MTDKQFTEAQDKIDALTRKTRRGTVGEPEQLASYKAITEEWEGANALPQIKKVDRDHRDAALLAVAVKHGLVAVAS